VITILLAAGRGSRMGRPKGLVDVKGTPWIVRQLEAIPTPVIVVVGEERYAGLLGDREIAINLDPNPFLSVKAGAMKATGAAAFLLPLDVPCPDPRVFRALEQAGPAAVPIYEGRGGHPVLVPLDPVRRAEDADRLDHLLARLNPRRVPVDDPRVRMNLNTPDDWAAFFSRYP
jgi:CTP:molybdopterin cytidylyltransferase MocA